MNIVRVFVLFFAITPLAAQEITFQFAPPVAKSG